MSRELRRVPLDFDWPLEKTWWGYLVHVALPPCPACDGGWSDLYHRLRADYVNGKLPIGMGELYTYAKETHGDEAITCQRCKGSATAAPKELQEEAEAWETAHQIEPPTGDGWQLWETVSEGSPISPVFETAVELVEFMSTPAPEARSIPWAQGYSRAAAEAFVKTGHSVASFVMSANGEITDGVEALVELQPQ